MYYKPNTNKTSHYVPFRIQCTNCESYNVTATAFEYYDLEIKCNCCGAYLSWGSYNENTYSE